MALTLPRKPPENCSSLRSHFDLKDEASDKKNHCNRREWRKFEEEFSNNKLHHK